MKSIQRVVKKNSNLDNEIAEIQKINPKLMFVFGGLNLFKEGTVLKTISEKLKGTIIIGCSTAGEISDKGMSEDTLVLTACHFEKTQEFQTAMVPVNGINDSLNAGKALASKFSKDNMTALFILGPGVNVNGSAIIDGLREVIGENVTITGGLAADAGNFTQTFTILNGEIQSDKLIGLAVYGNNLKVAFGSMGGWQPFGPIRQVTKAEGNILFELDGEPALDLYKKYLGDDANKLPASGLLYPFAILNNELDESGVIRTILGVDEAAKSLILAGDIPNKGSVRLMHADKAGLTLGAKGAAEKTFHTVSAKAANGVGILVSCIGRKIVMGSDIDDELDAVKAVFGDNSSITGYYSNGEICPDSTFSACKLHNQTMTITYIYEE
ncbi:MAG: FIST N-terminal domain-containing protein [Bacteriovorax sp.]|nr:FIST N-terminal domain-containing protein [Bacteriovorax sp.]